MAARMPSGPRGPRSGTGARLGPTQCHDITAYPAIGLAAGACGGYGLLLDIRDVAHPKRIGAAADSNFAFWHSATFNNDGTKVLFTDEWGGGLQARCRPTDKREWGADAIFTLAGTTMTFQSYYKLPAPQTANANCVAHNGSLIPIPGRDIMVQGWYQRGISVFDWTDPAHPEEIAFFDRGPMGSPRPAGAVSWPAYWYKVYTVSSEIARGLGVVEWRPGCGPRAGRPPAPPAPPTSRRWERWPQPSPSSPTRRAKTRAGTAAGPATGGSGRVRGGCRDARA